MKFEMESTMTQDITTLIEQRANLDAQIAAMQKASKTENVKKARDFVAKHGLTAADVFPSAASATRTIAKPAPKYKDANGNTWSGRGLKPRWLAKAIAEGAKLEDFAIATEAL